MRCNYKRKSLMSEVELLLVNSSDSCTMYTIQFLFDDMSEFEKFVSKFRQDAELAGSTFRQYGDNRKRDYNR